MPFTPTDTDGLHDGHGHRADQCRGFLPRDATDPLVQSPGHHRRHAAGAFQLMRRRSLRVRSRILHPTGLSWARARTQLLSVMFTPFDISHYTTATGTVHINVDPPIAFGSPRRSPGRIPRPSLRGTPLGPAKLDATASVPGTFVYNPPAGNPVASGREPCPHGHVYSRDTAHYTTATATVHMSVFHLYNMPPQVVGLVYLTFTKKALTAMRIAFNEAMVSSSVEQLTFYSVLGGVKKKGKTSYSKRVGVKGISFDGNHTVTLNLSKPYKGAVKVTVHGGIMAANGELTSGDFSQIVL